MENVGLDKETEMPERLVHHLAFRLKRHKLWDFSLVLLPPILASSYLIFFLFFRHLLSLNGLLIAGVVLLGGALTVWLVSRRSGKDPSSALAARLIDGRVGGQDRFITLATLPPSIQPSYLLARLRREAAGLLRLLDFKRDFPYRMKPAFFLSLIGSLAAVLLLHLLLQVVLLSQPQAAPVEELALLAKRLSQAPGLSELARRLEAAARRMEEMGLSTREKLAAVQRLQREVEDRAGADQRRGEGKGDLLNQVADALQRLEKGLEGDRDQGEGAGLKSNLPEEKGNKKESGKGGGGEGKSESADLGKKELKEGKAAEREPNKEDLSAGVSEKEKGQGKRIEREKEKGRETEGMAKGEREGKGGKNREEEIPQGKAPERFAKPGEQGLGGIKGSRFVIVELPETLESAGSSESAGSEGARKKLDPKTPISNVPLPRPAGSQASPERQPVPLEYRGLIR